MSKQRLYRLGMWAITLSGGALAARPAFGQVADPNGYFLYTQNPNASVIAHSYLVGNTPHQGYNPAYDVSDTTFSNWIGQAFNAPGGPPNIQDADFFFQQCFGGGMIAGLPNALGNIPWVAGSASTYAQTALATPRPSPNVQPQYATWSYALTPQLTLNPATKTILSSDKYAYSNDFFGPNGYVYRETPQYAAYNGGSALTLSDPTAADHYAVFYVGDTSSLIQSMQNVIYDNVNNLATNAWKGEPFKISVLFGNGASSAGLNPVSGKNLAQAINNFNAQMNPGESIQLTSANPANLQAAIANVGKSADSFQSQFLFFGFDHGGTYRAGNPVRRGAANPSAPAGNPVWTDSFSLEDPNSNNPNPNPNGEVNDTTNEEDPADPPSITITYQGLDAKAAGPVNVLVNGMNVGLLDPTNTTTTLAIPTADLLDTNSLEIDDNSGENISILTDQFDSGALPPQDDTAEAPEPGSLTLLLLGAAGALLRRRQRASAECR